MASGYDSGQAELIFRLGAFVGSSIHTFHTLDRAMNKAREYITESERTAVSVKNGTAFLAESMGGSRGRFARTWHAPPGGLWGCVIIADTFLPLFRNFLPLIPGISCCETARSLGVENCHIRWVNDVMADGRKMAGFLLETFVSPRHRDVYHLLGFGINVNNRSFPKEIAANSISLCQHLGRELDICTVALNFFTSLRWHVGLLLHEEGRWLESGGGSSYELEHPVLRTWKGLSDTIGKRVRFGYDVVENPQYSAVVKGISGDGGLILEHDDGNISIEHSGEIRYI